MADVEPRRPRRRRPSRRRRQSRLLASALSAPQLAWPSCGRFTGAVAVVAASGLDGEGDVAGARRSPTPSIAADSEVGLVVMVAGLHSRAAGRPGRRSHRGRPRRPPGAGRGRPPRRRGCADAAQGDTPPCGAGSLDLRRLLWGAEACVPVRCRRVQGLRSHPCRHPGHRSRCRCPVPSSPIWGSRRFGAGCTRERSDLFSFRRGRPDGTILRGHRAARHVMSRAPELPTLASGRSPRARGDRDRIGGGQRLRAGS